MPGFPFGWGPGSEGDDSVAAYIQGKPQLHWPLLLLFQSPQNPCLNRLQLLRRRFKSCGLSTFWWIWIGFCKFCLTGFGVDLRIIIWTSLQLPVLFRVCRLLHLFCKFSPVEFITFVEIVHPVFFYIENIGVLSSDVRYKPALLCIISSKSRKSCDFHWSIPLYWTKWL